MSKIFPMKPSEFKIFILVESHNDKTDENFRNCHVAEKRSRRFKGSPQLGPHYAERHQSLKFVVGNQVRNRRKIRLGTPGKVKDNRR